MESNRLNKRGIIRFILLAALVCFSVMSIACEKTCTKNEDCPVLQHCDETSKTCLSQCKEDKDCKETEICLVSLGQCKENKASCTPKAKKDCVGRRIYWFDSCGTQSEEIEDCGQRGCLDGVCKKGDVCGDGTCSTGSENCSSCPQDCACQSGEVCNQDGVCQRTCGDGKCEEGNETCTSCPQDCRCERGKICSDGACKASRTCGNGTCESGSGEDCTTCPYDCSCKSGEACVSGTCEALCGNGTCDHAHGENCTVCSSDCKCEEGKVCKEGFCTSTCGNGKCEPAYGENCVTCAKDCACAGGQKCGNDGQCGSACGNGKCEASKGENCATCSKDCACVSTRFCSNGECKLWCGNGVCDQARGENCSVCAVDCKCPDGQFCDDQQQCKAYCGNGKCEPGKGEDCDTCVADCGCKDNKSCVEKQCQCVPDCKGKDCGDDGCGGSCGACTSSRQTCEKGKCTCQDECKKGTKSQCVNSENFKLCLRQKDGCYEWKEFSCPSNRTCTNGTCCKLQCDGKECGDNGCGGDCGYCSQRSVCSKNKCTCKHECSRVGDTRCSGGTNYQECYQDPSGCRYWSSAKTCGRGNKCYKNKCCKPSCSGRECGTDGCGGKCGITCSNCVSNQCRRTFKGIKIYAPCDTCTDWFNGNPEFYIELAISGKTYRSKDISTKCGKTLTYNWSVSNLDPRLLKSVKISIKDEDTDRDDTCVSWSKIDLTKINGKKTYTGKNKSYITIEVKK